METESKTKSWVSQHAGPLIGAGGAIFAALITGFFLLLSQQPDENATNIETPKFSTEPSVKDKTAPSSEPIETDAKPEKESKFELASYKEIYDFAYSAGGMNQTSSAAKDFAELWVSKCASESFESFKEAYKFAYSAGGMNMTSSDAKVWAIGKTKCLNH